eukprot:Lithocolla_globosa_v1_NODE_1584_length_2467_cov_5.572139.p1 type:complete len:763 gc:universal NODE_1584_length_2467_cov_5.572139:2427-139(-)
MEVGEGLANMGSGTQKMTWNEFATATWNGEGPLFDIFVAPVRYPVDYSKQYKNGSCVPIIGLLLGLVAGLVAAAVYLNYNLRSSEEFPSPVDLEGPYISCRYEAPESQTRLSNSYATLVINVEDLEEERLKQAIVTPYSATITATSFVITGMLETDIVYQRVERPLINEACQPFLADPFFNRPNNPLLYAAIGGGSKPPADIFQALFLLGADFPDTLTVVFDIFLANEQRLVEPFNCEEVPGWTCEPCYYDHDDGCDCECGIIDPDCTPDADIFGCDPTTSCFDGVCLVPSEGTTKMDENEKKQFSQLPHHHHQSSPNTNPTTEKKSQQKPSSSHQQQQTRDHITVPSNFTCPSSYYHSQDGCDCNCGVFDPDCSDPLAQIYGCFGENIYCTFDGMCSPIPEDQPSIPAEWQCDSSTYSSQDGCDCNCGVRDPDCDLSDTQYFVPLVGCPVSGSTCNAEGVCQLPEYPDNFWDCVASNPLLSGKGVVRLDLLFKADLYLSRDRKGDYYFQPIVEAMAECKQQSWLLFEAEMNERALEGNCTLSELKEAVVISTSVDVGTRRTFLASEYVQCFDNKDNGRIIFAETWKVWKISSYVPKNLPLTRKLILEAEKELWFYFSRPESTCALNSLFDWTIDQDKALGLQKLALAYRCVNYPNAFVVIGALAGYGGIYLTMMTVMMALLVRTFSRQVPMRIYAYKQDGQRHFALRPFGVSRDVEFEKVNNQERRLSVNPTGSSRELVPMAAMNSSASHMSLAVPNSVKI